MAKKDNTLEKKSFVMRFLDGVEKAGNALPNPATIFLILTALVLVLSAVCANLGVSVTYETIDTANGNAIVETTVSAGPAGTVREEAFSLPAGGDLMLEVRLEISEAGEISVLCWRTVYSGGWDVDDTITLWDGD